MSDPITGPANEKQKKLAVFGGSPVRSAPFPARGSIGAEEKAAVNALLDAAIASGGAVGYGGAEEEAYCREFSESMGGGFADAVNSGTTAVYVALRALNLEPFTEIIVSPITDPGGMMPIPLLNCIPVIADAAPGSYNTDAAQIEKMITPRTSAIVVAHIGGEPVDMEAVMRMAKKHSLPVVEDCAQSHHASLNGKFVGSFGDAAAISTMFGKHHCTGGQGGLVFTKSEDLYWRIRRASDRGKPFNLPPGSGNCIASLNFNSDEFACCIGRAQLKKLPGFVEGRRRAAERVIPALRALKAVSVPELVPGARHAYWWWRLKFNEGVLTCDKPTFCAALRAEGLGVATDYGAALPQFKEWFTERRIYGNSGYPWASPDYKGDRNQTASCPNALRSVKDHFNVTVNESYTERDMEDFAAIFRKVEEAYLA